MRSQVRIVKVASHDDRVRAALAFPAGVGGLVVVSVLFAAGPGGGSAWIRDVGLRYALSATVAAGVFGAVVGPAAVNATSGMGAAFRGAGVVVRAAALYVIGWAVVYGVVEALVFELPRVEAAGGLIGLLTALSGLGSVLVLAAVVGVFMLWAVPVGAAVGWWLWFRRTASPPGDAP